MPLISSDFARGTPTGCSRRRRAQRDALTGLASRWLFEERLSDALQSAQKTGRQLGLLVVDCDNFKRVNNLLGHDAGDDVLVEIASRLRAAVRSFDSVARMGGDGFMILLDRLQGAKEAMELAQGVLHALGEPLVLVGQTAHTTASLGLCVYPEDGATAEELLRNADAAMYQAKTEGRNRVQRFTPEMERSLARRRELEAALEQALTRDEFELVYQPRVLVQTGEVTGVEALLRWRSSRLGLVMPGEFIAIAEENGLIVPIGKWVLDTACREMRQISKDMGKDLPFAVNVSPRQFQRLRWRDMRWRQSRWKLRLRKIFYCTCRPDRWKRLKRCGRWVCRLRSMTLERATRICRT
jgi:diguanylate cyclase (GGDEF)-like protein